MNDFRRRVRSDAGGLIIAFVIGEVVHLVVIERGN